MQREINYARKPRIYGNSCKVNALFNKGAHPCPSLFEESSVHSKIPKSTGKTKETKTTKEVKAKTIKTIEKTTHNKTTETFRPMSAKVDMGLKVCFCFVLWFSRWLLIFVCFGLFGCFGFFGFPYGVRCFQTCALYV